MPPACSRQLTVRRARQRARASRPLADDAEQRSCVCLGSCRRDRGARGEHHPARARLRASAFVIPDRGSLPPPRASRASSAISASQRSRCRSRRREGLRSSRVASCVASSPNSVAAARRRTCSHDVFGTASLRPFQHRRLCRRAPQAVGRQLSTYAPESDPRMHRSEKHVRQAALLSGHGRVASHLSRSRALLGAACAGDGGRRRRW
jgi:hypothetical protein